MLFTVEEDTADLTLDNNEPIGNCISWLNSTKCIVPVSEEKC